MHVEKAGDCRCNSQFIVASVAGLTRILVSLGVNRAAWARSVALNRIPILPGLENVLPAVLIQALALLDALNLMLIVHKVSAIGPIIVRVVSRRDVQIGLHGLDQDAGITLVLVVPASQKGVVEKLVTG